MNKNSTSLLPLNRNTASSKNELNPKVLQFGGGNFLRGFIDWMVETLNEQTDFNGGIIIVKPTERGDYTALKNQEGLFHVSTNGIKEGKLISENKLITCINQVLHPYNQWDDFLKTAEISSLRFVVSNTTEAGIQTNAADQFTDSPPHEFPAKLTRWLHRRFIHFKGDKEKGCVLLPCELIENNGEALRKCILQYAAQWSLEEDFQTWILEDNVFCNTLVDRIVPGFPTARKEELFQKIGFQDDLLVDAEPYHIFVIQSPQDITHELPFPQTDLNVVFTEDLDSYRKLKVRILNGAHTSMVPVGYLSGISSVREAVEDAKVGPYIQGVLFEEIIPSLDFPKAVSEKYANDILDRFRNPFIHHQLISIALNSVSKFKTRVLPSLLDYFDKQHTLPPRIVFAFASLIWFYRAKRGKEAIPLKDNLTTISFFKNTWEKTESGLMTLPDLVSSILEKEDFWEQDLNEINGLKEMLVGYLEVFEREGYQLRFG